MSNLRLTFTCTALLTLLCCICLAVNPEAPRSNRPEPSSMGGLFMGLTPLPSWLESVEHPSPALPAEAISGLPWQKGAADGDINVTPGGTRFQSETTIAVSDDLVVVGFNDAMGFTNPDGISVSGFSYSSDGGASYTYGGQLPVLGTGDAVRGDPDVKVWVDPQNQDVTFVYSSIYRNPDGENSLCVHVSIDGGATWDGPREVTTISSASDFADKEFLDIDPETGRLLLSWTSFGSSLEMRTTYSDDFGLTWAPATAFSARPQDGQGSCPRFDPAGDNAYIIWRIFGFSEGIAFVRSEDNGQTWGAPQDIITGLATPMSPYGSDRINGFPALAVSPFDGDLHLVYASRQTADFGDVYYSRSDDAGETWSGPIALNSNPGNDRAQWFSWISVNDAAPERIDAIWYDQRAGSEASDLTDLVHVHSYDGGLTWSAPAALTLRPFHAEYGQDTGQPNIGDYNQCVSQGSDLYVSYARTDVADYQTLAPDTYVALNDATMDAVALRLAGVDVSDLGCESDGLLVAGEIADLTITLASDEASSSTAVTGDLSVLTPGVSILSGGNIVFDDVPALGTASNPLPVRIRLSDQYACGQSIQFGLAGTASGGSWRFEFELPTGTETGAVVLLQENFDETASGLPPDWTLTQLKGVSNPWEVSTAYAASGTRSLFCEDLSDTNWSRVESPAMIVPTDAQLIEVSFKVTYDIEETGDGRTLYDGALLKLNIDDAFVLAGAFCTLFEGQYRTQIVRGSGPQGNPLQDLSAWGGTTLPDFESIRVQFPGLAGTTVKLVFEMGSDISEGGTGIFVDDVMVRSLPLACGPCSATPQLAVAPQVVAFAPIPAFETSCLPVTVRNDGDGFMDILMVSGCNQPPFSVDLTGMDFEVLPHDSTVFHACVHPIQQGPDTCLVVLQTTGGTQVIPVIFDLVTAVADPQQVPAVLTISGVAPNPFNPKVEISYGLPGAGPVNASVHDVTGRKVRDLLLNAPREAGFHTLVWDGAGQQGEAVASGVYLFRIRAGGQTQIARGTLVR